MKEPQTKSIGKPQSQIRKAFKRLSHQVNRPIIVPDAISRGYLLPSQKQFKELSTLAYCIENVRHLVATIAQKIKDQEELELVRTRHKASFARRPELAKMDPATHLMGRKEKTLSTRHATAVTLLSELEGAYKELSKGDYEAHGRGAGKKSTRR